MEELLFTHENFPPKGVSFSDFSTPNKLFYAFVANWETIAITARDADNFFTSPAKTRHAQTRLMGLP